MRYSIMLPQHVKWGKKNKMDQDARADLNLYSAYYQGSWVNCQLWNIDCEPEIYSWLVLKYDLSPAPESFDNDLMLWDDDNELVSYDDKEDDE